MHTVILVDFDGTITKEDTCIAMANNFAKKGWKMIEEEWRSGKLTTEQCSLKLFEFMDVDQEKLEKLLYSIEIDESFIDFLDFCKIKKYHVIITSDGFDFNIKTILSRYNINLEFYSNKLEFTDGIINAEFYTSKECEKCGMCKLNVLKKFKDNNTRIIYIGDGYSDICVAKYADVVFAKNVLLSYCIENNISHIPFNNFSDIIKKLK
ncbi:MAG: MtnX-like HAD-IB family phosphatase [Thermoanaerobacteraceae bacterium]|nr:MtnX-like HAD-IB family phosphatase [Thermoanaerobacteraceae bacterium]